MAINAAHIGVMLRVHRRAQYIGPIFDQVVALAKGRRATIIVRTDRPSMEVISSLNRAIESLPDHVQVELIEAVSRTRSDMGERWEMSAIEMHETLLGLNDVPDVGMMWDDDVLFTKEAIADLRDHLAFFDRERVEIRWAMCHDSPVIENKTFPAHWATCAFRVHREDTWSRTLLQHAPEHASAGTYHKMDSVCLHYGYLTDEDRQTAWLNAKASGKLDAHTYALIRPPRLEEINAQEEK